MLRSLGSALALVVVMVSMACFGPGGATPDGASTPVPERAAFVESQPRQAPLRIVVFVDKTASAPHAACPQPTASDFQPLVQAIRSRGGELAVGLICASSDRPLMRLRIEQPPEAPRANASAVNAFDRRQEFIENERRLSEHRELVREWASGVDTAVRSFQSRLGELLNAPPACQRTDVFGAMARADLYLSENDDSWTVSPARYVVLASDGLHNTPTRATPLQSRPRLLLVNGAGSIGALSAFSPDRFESLEAAIRFIRSH